MVLTVKSARVYGKVMREGDEFECPDKEARLWGALARAVPIGGTVAGDGQLGLIGESGGDQGEVHSRRQRPARYGRRDMRAEG
jgi:hypothetical protein